MLAKNVQNFKSDSIQFVSFHSLADTKGKTYFFILLIQKQLSSKPLHNLESLLILIHRVLVGFQTDSIYNL